MTKLQKTLILWETFNSYRHWTYFLWNVMLHILWSIFPHLRHCSRTVSLLRHQSHIKRPKSDTLSKKFDLYSSLNSKTLLDYWSYAYLEIVYLGHRRIRYPPANSQPSYCKTRWFRTVVQLSIWKGPQPSKQKKWSRIAFDRHEENQNGSTPSKYALGNLSKANSQIKPSTNPC